MGDREGTKGKKSAGVDEILWNKGNIRGKQVIDGGRNDIFEWSNGNEVNEYMLGATGRAVIHREVIIIREGGENIVVIYLVGPKQFGESQLSSRFSYSLPQTLDHVAIIDGFRSKEVIRHTKDGVLSAQFLRHKTDTE